MRDDDRTALTSVGAFVFGIYVVGMSALLLCGAVAIDQQRRALRRWLGRRPSCA